MTKSVEYFAGFELGQPHEFTALAVVEKTIVVDTTGRREVRYAVRFRGLRIEPAFVVSLRQDLRHRVAS